jgi:hypothetical protein
MFRSGWSHGSLARLMYYTPTYDMTKRLYDELERYNEEESRGLLQGIAWSD